MQTRWTKGLDEERAKDLISQLKASTSVLERLGKLIQEDSNNCTKLQESKESYASPSWAYIQADCIGELRVYKKILRLITLKDK